MYRLHNSYFVKFVTLVKFVNLVFLYFYIYIYYTCRSLNVSGVAFALPADEIINMCAMLANTGSGVTFELPGPEMQNMNATLVDTAVQPSSGPPR